MPFSWHRGEVFEPVIAELAVYLVSVQVKIVFLHDGGELLQFFLGIQVSRRVVRVDDHDTFRARGDHFLDLLDRGQSEVCLDGGGNGFHDDTAREGERVVVRVERFGDNHLVTRVQGRHESDRDCLGTSGGNHDVRFVDVDTYILVILG